MNKIILVTGGAGYIGSHTIVELLNSGFDVVSVDNFSNSSVEVYERIKKITSKDFHWYEADINNEKLLRQIFEKHKISGIIHFAAYKSVGESVESPLKYYHNNINGLLTILALCQEFYINNLIFSSSCSVYGNVKKLPVNESSPLLEAESPYAYTKQIGEKILQDFSKSSDEVKIISLRYFNPVGAHFSALIGENPINKPNNLVPIITGVAIGKFDRLIVHGNDYSTPDGTCIRDYIHVCDLAEAHVKAMMYLFEDKMRSNYDVFNLGTGRGVSVMEAILAFEKVSGIELKYSIGQRREGDVVAVYADSTKAFSELSWTARFGIEEMMQSAWNWELAKGKPD